MTQVLIVEDQKMIRESLENLVAQADDLSPAGSLSCAALAEQYCMRGNIDLILMDVCTENDESGFVAAEKIKKRFPSIKIIIITSMLDYSYLDKARKAGAESIWFKDVSAEELAQELCVTPDCVKAHVSSMLSKTGYSSKTKLAAVVTSKKLIVNGF